MRVGNGHGPPMINVICSMVLVSVVVKVMYRDFTKAFSFLARLNNSSFFTFDYYCNSWALFSVFLRAGANLVFFFRKLFFI